MGECMWRVHEFWNLEIVKLQNGVSSVFDQYVENGGD